MPTIPEATLASWTKPAFDNEDEKREHTERTIREAIKAHPVMRGLAVSVYAKGSFKNNTNVRRDSDVDVAVELTSVYKAEFVEGVTRDDVGFVPYADPYETDNFKDDVGEALTSAFGRAVTRHNKVFTVREGSRNLAADVVPCYTHKWFYANGPSAFARGIQLITDKPTPWPVNNFPQQHYDNGCEKNASYRTAKRFKRVVRILKRLENQMVDDGASPEVASYLIESLVYNVPDDRFGTGTWAGDVRNILLYIWDNTDDPACEKQWTEVNGIKYLFHSGQKWTRDEARAFIYAAWQYVNES